MEHLEAEIQLAVQELNKQYGAFAQAKRLGAGPIEEIKTAIIQAKHDLINLLTKQLF